jgi:anaerobic magnesium-protoporphyrin IX monomethyl ester cyclase
MVKVLFVYHNELEEGFMPASLAVLGGVMKRDGIETKLFDTSFWRDISSKLVENDREIRERTGEFKKVLGYNPEREIVDIKKRFYESVKNFKPDLIAATSTSYEFNSLIDFMSPTKKRFDLPLIVGGSHATVFPEKAICKEEVDMICVGEGEVALSELVKRLEKKRDFTDIPNLWVKNSNGEIIKNKVGTQVEMDDLPEPDWDIFDSRHSIRPFEGELKNYGFFEISRGCPFNCSYCINAKIHEVYKESGINSKLYRFHSPEEIVRRIKKYKEKYDFNHIQFVDENLSVMPIASLRKLADLYSKEVGVGFFAMARPEGFINEPEKSDLFAKMNCKMIALGAESGNEELKRNILNRPMKNKTLEDATRLLKKSGILVSLYNIIGFPTETREMIFDTIRLNRRIQPDRYSVRFLTPYPGTAISDYCIEHNYIEEDYEDKRNVSFLIEPILNLPTPPHPTKQELMEIKSNWKNYMNMSDEEFERIARG